MHEPYVKNLQNKKYKEVKTKIHSTLLCYVAYLIKLHEKLKYNGSGSQKKY